MTTKDAEIGNGKEPGRTSGINLDVSDLSEEKIMSDRRPHNFLPEDNDILEFAPDAVVSIDPASLAIEYSSLKLDSIPIKGIKRLLFGVVVLFAVISVWEVASVLIEAWNFHWIIGSIVGVLILLVFIFAVQVTVSFVKGHERIDKVKGLRETSRELTEESDCGNSSEFIDDLKRFYSGKPHEESLVQCLSNLPDYSNDREVVTYIDQKFIKPLDEEAINRISKFSIQTSAAIAASPWTSIDMLLSLWRNITMINEIAQIYGIRPSINNKFKLLKLVVQQITYLAGSELVVDQLIKETGAASIISVASTRVAQGIGAGVYSAKIGMAAMDICRPVIYGKNEKPKLSAIVKPMYAYLTKLFVIKS